MTTQTGTNRHKTLCRTVDELAEAAGVTSDTIRSAIRRREIAALRIGRLWRIPEHEFRRVTGTSGEE